MRILCIQAILHSFFFSIRIALLQQKKKLLRNLVYTLELFYALYLCFSPISSYLLSPHYNLSTVHWSLCRPSMKLKCLYYWFVPENEMLGIYFLPKGTNFTKISDRIVGPIFLPSSKITTSLLPKLSYFSQLPWKREVPFYRYETCLSVSLSLSCLLPKIAIILTASMEAWSTILCIRNAHFCPPWSVHY